jgi:hypothetical protein
MRILFVNACHSTGKGYYRSCVKLISRMVLQQQYVCDTELDLIEVEAVDLNDYLYELETSRSSTVVTFSSKCRQCRISRESICCL